MDGLSSAASAIAIASLAIQLVDSVQRISKFLKKIPGAPKEVFKLIETLDQLQGTLDNVRQLIETQFLVLRLPGSPTFIIKAIENCEEQITALEAFVSISRKSLEHQSKLRKSWASMKIVSKKHDIEEIHCRLRDAKLDLQFSLSSNSWHLQMYHIQNTVPIVHPNRLSQQVNTLHFVPHRDEDEDTREHEVSSLRSTNLTKFPPPSTEEKHVTWYNGMFGIMSLKLKSKYPKSPHSSAEGKIPLASERIWFFRPAFMSYTLELGYARSFGHVSRSFNIYPVLKDSNPIFTMCQDGDLLGLQTALSGHSVSPFVTDSRGWTLLHYAARCGQIDVCKWLLSVGLNADATNRYGWKPLHFAAFRLESNDKTRGPRDLFRILAQHQDDISSRDLVVVTYSCRASAEEVDLLLTHSSVQFDDSSKFTEPLLALAVRSYGGGFCLENTPNNDLFGWIRPTAYQKNRRQWELLIRRLICKGADLHVQLKRDYIFDEHPYDVEEYITPLDLLFQFSETPEEARRLGPEWLGFLKLEGYNVLAYLKQEIKLHASQHQITYRTWTPLKDYHKAPRKLQYNLDDAQPSVWWEWWIDPATEIELLECEFTDIIKQGSTVATSAQWLYSSPWPFDYPKWHLDFAERAQSWPGEYLGGAKAQQQLARLATQRADRRLQKRYAKGRHSGGLRHRRMPGAWPV